MGKSLVPLFYSKKKKKKTEPFCGPKCSARVVHVKRTCGAREAHVWRTWITEMHWQCLITVRDTEKLQGLQSCSRDYVARSSIYHKQNNYFHYKVSIEAKKDWKNFLLMQSFGGGTQKKIANLGCCYWSPGGAGVQKMQRFGEKKLIFFNHECEQFFSKKCVW